MERSEVYWSLRDLIPEMQRLNIDIIHAESKADFKLYQAAKAKNQEWKDDYSAERANKIGKLLIDNDLPGVPHEIELVPFKKHPSRKPKRALRYEGLPPAS